MLKKKISFIAALMMTVVAASCTFLLASWLEKKTAGSNDTVIDNSIQAGCSAVNIIRLNGYEFIRPLLFGDNECQSEKLMPVRNLLEKSINAYKEAGTISAASVYLRELSQGAWVAINEQEKYNPGSLLKVPELITFMKMNQKTPGLLDKKIVYSAPLVLKKQAFYISKSIEVGKTYTVRELLYYMIAYSDNNATMILNQMMDLAIFKKLFTDLGLPDPDMTKNDIPIGAKEFSYFMRALYNASYLTIEESEYCTELLSHSDFNKGLLNGLPAGLKVAHKFGEASDGVNAHLSESGIIYLNNAPYLLIVMTKGKNNILLPGVISDLSQTVFNSLSRG